MRSLVIKSFLWLYNVYALLLFIAIMLIIFPFVIIASFFNPIQSGNTIYRLCMIWADIWFPFTGIIHKNYYEVSHDKKKAYIFVSNHISYLDAPIIVKTFRQHLRALGKVEMIKVPVFGFIYKNAIVTVDRDNASDRSNSVQKLKNIIQKGISILIFPEGTFNETGKPLKSFYDGAFRIAIETQTPIKPVLFLDAYDRMPYKGFFTLNPGKSRSIFLEEIAVEGLSIDDLPLLKNKVFAIMEKKLMAYKASWIKPQ